MRLAVEEYDIAQLMGLIVQVDKIDGSTARGLQVLADRYDYAKLSQWLEKEIRGPHTLQRSIPGKQFAHAQPH